MKTIDDIRRQLVALNRSLDEHVTDAERLEILKSDFAPIWHRLCDLLNSTTSAEGAKGE